MQDITTFLSNHAMLAFAACVVIIFLLMIEALRAKRGSFNINPLQTTQLINHHNAIVIDIRDEQSFQNGHIIDAMLMSISDIKQLNKKIEKLKGKALVIVCNTGVESQKIATFLLKNGYNAYSLAGGMRAWLNAEMPVIKENVSVKPLREAK